MPNPTPAIEVYDLRVDGRREALTVTEPRPTLQWRMRGTAVPESVRIQAATTPAALDANEPDLWDTGELPFTTPGLQWEGPLLASGQTVHWRVGVRVSTGESWSGSTLFGVALREGGDWGGAGWITHPAWSTTDAADGLPVVETRFAVPEGVSDARLYLAASGVVAVTINGAPASADVLAPGYADYGTRVPAVGWDVTEALIPGEVNTLRVELGTGVSWVPPTDRYTKLIAEHLLPRVLARLELHSAETDLAIVSDGSWTAALTATSVAHWFGGEDFDARVADHDERPVAVLGGSDLHTVWWSEYPGLRITERIPARSVTRLDDGARIVDFGTNVAGWPEVTLVAESGVAMQLWPGELLDAEGRVAQQSTGTPLFDTYTTSEGIRSWHPRFVYHGFRYLEVRGLPEAAPDPDFVALVIRADNATAGSFATDDPYLNTLDRLIDRSIQGNMYSIFTDCPNREKLGWIEQLYLCFDALARHYDVDAHLRDAIVQMSDSQLDSGSIPSIAPETVDFSNHEFNGDPNAFRDDPNWGGAMVFLPWRLYENYGDRPALERAWPSIVRYVDYLVSREEDGIVDFGLGDWIAIDMTTPRPMVATFGYLQVLETAARIAGVLGRDEGVGYLDRALRVRSAFAARFESPGDLWGSGSQASYALALDAGVVTQVDAVRQRLLDSIAANGGRISVGENAWPSLMRVLHAMGRDDITAQLVRNDEGPGYGWQVRHGATALAESWLGATGAENDNSQNHFMLGMVHDWMTQVVGGLAQCDDSIGWVRADIAPTPIAGVSESRVSYDSPFGEYVVAWRDGERFTLTATVPPGGSASVTMPRSGDRHEVRAGVWEFTS